MAIAPLSFKQRLLYAACLGVAIGGIATLYYVALQFILWAVWTWLPNTLRPGSAADFRSFAWFLTALGGLLVGVIVSRLGAPTGLNEAIDEIHREGRIGYRQMPGMVIASLVSLGFGSSAGPEAPLVDINGGVASWVADRLKLSQVDSRTLTFCGISAALGAFFGSPLGSALLALELPHSFGLEYYEAIIPVMVAAIAKMFTLSLSIQSGFRGGVIFPIFLIGAAVGMAAKINSERVYGVLADQCPSMELDLNEVSRVSAPRIFEFTIAVGMAMSLLISDRAVKMSIALPP